MGPFRHRLLSVVLILAATVPAPAAAQSPSPTPGPSPTPIPARVGFEAIPNQPGVGAEPGGLPWVQVVPPLPEGRHLWSVMTWAGGFAALEWADRKQAPDQAVAIWRSADGTDWTRAPLPTAAANAWYLLAQGDDLVLSVLIPTATDTQVHVDLWRSADAVDWRRSGTFQRQLPPRDRKAWELRAAALLVIRGRLVLLTATTHRDNGSGGSAADAPQLATAGGAALAQLLPLPENPEHMTGWVSRTGERWSGRRVEGVVTSLGTVSLGIQGQGPDGPLGIVEGLDPALVTSRNGLTWTRVAGLPEDWTSLGSFGIIWSDGGPLVIADSDKEAGGAGCGNRVGGWRLDTAATAWTEVLDRQAAIAHGLAAEGTLVIVPGGGWCTAPDWGWTLVSTDGGRTWDPDLSWTGRPGTCVGDVAIKDGVAVMLGCPDDGHPIWRAELPATATSEPSPEPSAPA